MSPPSLDEEGKCIKRYTPPLCLHTKARPRDSVDGISVFDSKESSANTTFSLASNSVADLRSTEAHHAKMVTCNTWTTVHNKKNDQKSPRSTSLLSCQTSLQTSENQASHHDLASQDYYDYKLACQNSYDPTHGQRRNFKEKSKRDFHIRSSKIKPHGLEAFNPLDPIEEEPPPFSPTSDSTPTPQPITREHLEKVALAPSVVPDTTCGELYELLKNVTSTVGDITDQTSLDWVSHLENIIILAYQLSRSKNFVDIFVAVVSYIKTNTRRSFVKEILSLIDEVVGSKDEISPHAFEAEDAIRNWDLFKNNPMFARVSYLLSAAMSLSVCSIKEIEWSPFGLKLVAIEAAKEQMHATDLCDALIHTFAWFSSTGYRVFETGSLKPLLYSDQAMQNYNEEVDYLMANADSAVNGNLGDITDFDSRVRQMMAKTSQLKATQTTGPTATWLQDRYSKLTQIQFRLDAKYKNSQLRFAPFGQAFTGDSSVGKSTLSKMFMTISLNAMGFSTDTKRTKVLNNQDAYDSVTCSDDLGASMDDVGQVKAQFVVKEPCGEITRLVNNVAAGCVKAELNGKGVVWNNHKVINLTSNERDFGIRRFSEHPGAMLRRFIFWRVSVKEKYRKHNSSVLDKSHPDIMASKELTLDIWDLTLEECRIYESKDGRSTYSFQIMTVVKNGKNFYCKKMNLVQAVDVCIILSKRHKVEQENLLARDLKFNLMEFCEECCRPSTLCSCPKPKPEEKVDPHSAELVADIILNSAKASVSNYFSFYTTPLEWFSSWLGYSKINQIATHQLTKEMGYGIHTAVTPYVISITPECLFQTSFFHRMMDNWSSSAVAFDMLPNIKRFQKLMFIGTSYSLYNRHHHLTGSLVFTNFVGSFCMWAHYRRRKNLIKEEYLSRRDALPSHLASISKPSLANSALLLSSILIGLKTYQVWQRQREIDLRNIDPNADESPGWFGLILRKMGAKVETSFSSKKASPSQLVDTLVKSNLYWATFTRADGTKTSCNIFMPRKSVALFPRHVFYPGSNMSETPTKTLSIEVDRSQKPGGQFSFKVDFDMCVKPSTHDLVCAYVPNCPDLRNKIKFLPLSQPIGNSICTLVMRREEDFVVEKVAVEHTSVGHKYNPNMYGGEYTTKEARVGSCMGCLVLEQSNPVIAGFHIGGIDSKNYGIMQTVTAGEMTKMIDELEAIPGIIVSSDAGDIPETQYDRSLIEVDEIHPASMCSSLSQKDYIEVLGSTKLRTVQRSRVIKSPLSDAVTEVMGIPNVWDGPQLAPNWRGYNETLAHIINPADQFSPMQLERARQDWIKPLLIDAAKLKSTPLTNQQSIMGIQGEQFIKPIVMSTGSGFPLFGAKRSRFTDVFEGTTLVDRVPSDEIKIEIDRMLLCWVNGTRAYPVTAATLKDEPTLVGSTKVRVFQASPVAFTILLRKYFLPIMKYLCENPIATECAVGINPFSPDWEKLVDSISKFASDDKFIGWDYSKYDVRMTSQMTRAVLASYIDLAKALGYDEISLSIMRNMIVDLVHPLMDWNGIMIMAFNMNTSGNSLTVMINSTAGAIYVRLGFFAIYPEACFRECVAVTTYGDDLLGSVHPAYRLFNFESYRDFLALHNMKITLPDKSTDSKKFLSGKHADFLKRTSKFIPDVGRSIGKLDENSIFKSLHANLKSAGATELVVASSCIDAAMHEWFAHGREHYELRASQMRKVCSIADVPSLSVHETYDDRVLHWKANYSEYVSQFRPL